MKTADRLAPAQGPGLHGGRRMSAQAPGTDGRATHTHYRRFDRADRLLHGFLMFSFLGLAFTGLPLLFSHEAWAARAGAALRRVPVGRHHSPLLRGRDDRACSPPTSSRICRRLFVQKDLSILWGPSSMVPQPRDFFEMVAHLRWFVGLGPAAAVRSLHLLGEVRLLGRVLGHGHHRRLRARALVPGVLRTRAARAGSSTSPCSSTAKRPCWPSGSSSRFTSSTATCGPRSSRWTR